MVLTGARVGAARKLLNWTMRKLAAKSLLSETTILNVESGAIMKDANACDQTRP
jgi:transcriptional regulator with XRE-family HTH domain